MSTIHSVHLVHCSHGQRDKKRQQNKKNKVSHTLTRIHTEAKTIKKHLYASRMWDIMHIHTPSIQINTHNPYIFLTSSPASPRSSLCVCVLLFFFFSSIALPFSFRSFISRERKLKSHFIFRVWCVHYSCRAPTKTAIFKQIFCIFRIIFKTWKFFRRFFFRLFESFVLFVPFFFSISIKIHFESVSRRPMCDHFVQYSPFDSRTRQWSLAKNDHIPKQSQVHLVDSFRIENQRNQLIRRQKFNHFTETLFWNKTDNFWCVCVRACGAYVFSLSLLLLHWLNIERDKQKSERDNWVNWKVLQIQFHFNGIEVCMSQTNIKFNIFNFEIG